MARILAVICGRTAARVSADGITPDATKFSTESRPQRRTFLAITSGMVDFVGTVFEDSSALTGLTIGVVSSTPSS